MNPNTIIKVAKAVAALVAVVVAGKKGKTLYDKKYKKISLGILGMPSSGKTRFLSFLRDIPFIEKETSKEKYNSFTYKYDETEIRIDKGVDIGGVEQFVEDYIPIIKKSEIIYYFFDINEYLYINDNKYRSYCNSRFELIHSKAKGRKVRFIGTHFDKCQRNEITVRKDFLELIKDKSYRSYLGDLFIINLTDETQLRRFIEENLKLQRDE